MQQYNRTEAKNELEQIRRNAEEPPRGALVAQYLRMIDHAAGHLQEA